MPYKRIDENTVGFTPDEKTISKEKLEDDLARHQGNLQELENRYQEEKPKLEERVETAQAILDLLN